MEDAARAAIAAGACPGVALGVARRGRRFWAAGVGVADIGAGAPLRPESIFRIGSLTKQFTAALIVRLAAQGRLGLDDPVARHLPAFAKFAPVTVRQLANQTAGLHSDESEDASTPSDGRRSQIDLANAITNQAVVFDFPPGTAWLYSNANYIVLGAVIEAVTGKPLAQAADAMIFKPLGLFDTAFDTAGATIPRRVAGYTPVEGQPGAFIPAAFIEVSEAGGAGAMRSTVIDLHRWHQALFSGRLFDARHVEIMLAPGRLTDGRLSGDKRFSPNDASYGEVQYAMGLLVSPPVNGVRSALHYGAINGFAACLETFVESGVTTVVLCNGDIGPDMPFRSIRRIVKDRILPIAA